MKMNSKPTYELQILKRQANRGSKTIQIVDAESLGEVKAKDLRKVRKLIKSLS